MVADNSGSGFLLSSTTGSGAIGAGGDWEPLGAWAGPPALSFDPEQPIEPNWQLDLRHLPESARNTQVQAVRDAERALSLSNLGLRKAMQDVRLIRFRN